MLVAENKLRWIARRELPVAGRWVVPAVMAGLLVVVLGLDGWWLHHFRRGYPLDVDEAGYMTIAFEYTAAWRSGGVSGLWNAFVAQVSQAPLVPLLTVPIALIREGILDSFGVLLGFAALLGFACYGIAKRVAGARYGLLGALAVLAAPGITDFTRIYIFALPAAAMLALSIWALLKSERLERRGWAIAFGCLLGACVLTRTMMLGLVVGPLAAAAIQVAVRRDGRGRAAVNLVLAIAAGCGLAALWLASAWSTVIDYLTGFGYGGQASQSGAAPSVGQLLVDDNLYLPLAVLVAFGLILGAATTAKWLVARSGLRRPLREIFRPGAPLREILGSGEFVLLVVVAEGWAALASTKNPGFGFELPLVPPLILLAVCAVAKTELKLLRHGLVAAVVAVSVMNLISKADVWPALSNPQLSSLPVLGDGVPVIDGESEYASGDLRPDGYRLGPPTQRYPPALLGWLGAERQTAAALLAIAHQHGREPIPCFGSTNPLFSGNTVGLAARLYYAVSLDFGQLDPTVRGDSVAAYKYQLSLPNSGPGLPPNELVLSERSPGEFPPIITQAKVRRAAEALGFREVWSLVLPDGRRASIWWLNRGQGAAS